MSLALHAINRLRKQYRFILNHMRELNTRLFNPPHTVLSVNPPCSVEPLEGRLLLSGTHYVVDSLADTIADDGALTLREAIMAANTNEILFEDIPVGSATEADIITFDQAALSAEAGVASGESLTITLSGTQLEIDDDLYIMGPGQDMLSIDANSLSRVMSVRSDVSLAGLTLTGGTLTGGTPTYRNGGGGVYNIGTLMLMSSTVSGNSTSNDGGGIYNDDMLMMVDSTVSGNSAGDGGGIYNGWDGVLMMTNSTVSDNSSADSGGGIYNESDAVAVTLTNSTVSGNSASSEGGGIYNRGTMTLTDSTVSDNSVVSTSSSHGYGGGIYTDVNCELTLIHSTVSGNLASGEGGGIYDANGDALTLTDSVVSGNSALVAGGIYNSAGNATLINSVVSGNLAAYCGGIYHFGSGMLKLISSTVAGNVVNSSDSISGYGIESRYGEVVLNNSIVALNYGPNNTLLYGMDIKGDFKANSSLIGMDPGFVRNPSAGIDGLWGTDDDDPGDLRLADTSLAIDFGDNALAVDGEGAALALDLDGNPRIANSLVDIGAYEYQGSPSSSRELSPVVTTLDDVVDSTDGLISLREALFYGGLLGEDVTFDSSLAGGTITLTAGELFIYQSVAVDATSIGGITIDADSQSRVMYIANCEVALTGLLLTGGLTAESGGGIFSVASTLVLTNSVVAGNSAYYSGGGIYSYGMLTLTNSTVSGNSATRDRLSYGGGIDNRIDGVILNNSIVSLNSAVNGSDIFGSLTSNSSLVDIDPGFVRSPSAGIDGIWGTADDDAGDLRLADTSLAIDFGNDALAVDRNGAALTIDIDGNPRIANGRVDIGAYEYQGSPSILRESPSFVVTTLDDIVDFTDGLISLREAIVYGGLLGGDVTFDAGLAGGTITLAGRNLYIYQSVNVDATSIGKITIDADGQSRVMFIAGGEVSLTGLLLTGGSITRGTGGIENYEGSLILTNSIVSGNVGESSGGISSYNGAVTLTNSTVTGNYSLYTSGGIRISAESVLTLNNSIVALNYGYEDTDISGDFISNNSLVGIDPGFVRNPSAGTDGIWGTGDDDAGYLRLADTSLAINFGNNALAVDASGIALTFDIEGNARIADGRVDIGAYEYQAAPSPAREFSPIVTTLDDVVDFSDGLISLREALVYGSLLDEDVTFDASLAGGTITLAGEQLYLYQSMTVDATSIGAMTIDADAQSRVMYIAGGDIYLTALILTGGSTTSDGGGIYNSESGNVTLTNSVVSGNNRGGIENDHGSLTLISSTISDNTASFGGGIDNIRGTVTLINSTISGNSGGGILNSSGSVTLTNSTISGNSGGGIDNSNGSVMLTNSTVSGNTGSFGGGISSSGGILTLANSTVTGNTAGFGGGISSSGGIVTLVNSTVTGNTGSFGGGIRNDDSTIVLTNSTVSGNAASTSGGGIRNDDGTVTLNNSVVALNEAKDDDDISGSYISNSSLVGIDPAFVRNPSAGDDGEWGTDDDDYGDLRLRPDSVAIDAGDNALAVDAEGDPLTTDIRGAARIFGASVDIGAYEYQDMAGDANGDEVVNLDDFIILKQNYGLAEGATKAEGDFNTDTGVNLDDFIILKQNYGTELAITPPVAASVAIEQSATPATPAGPADLRVASEIPAPASPAPSDTADILAATAVKPTLDPIGQLGWVSPLEALLADKYEILDIIAAR